MGYWDFPTLFVFVQNRGYILNSSFIFVWIWHFEGIWGNFQRSYDFFWLEKNLWQGTRMRRNSSFFDELDDDLWKELWENLEVLDMGSLKKLWFYGWSCFFVRRLKTFNTCLSLYTYMKKRNERKKREKLVVHWSRLEWDQFGKFNYG